MRYSWERGRGDPQDETARLLKMIEVGRMPAEQYPNMDGLMKGIATKVSRDWNCQNWVREALEVMVAGRLVAREEMELAVEE